LLTAYDSDADGLPDDLESNYGTDKSRPDSDEDGLSDGAEVMKHNTNPLNPDTDGGGIKDGREISTGTSPLDPADDKNASNTSDTDNDGANNDEESSLGTNPIQPDSDRDGLTDGAEIHTYHTNPLLQDSDQGGVSDGEEVAQGTNPLNASDDFSLQCSAKFGVHKQHNFECPSHRRYCNNGNGNGAETCSPSENGNSDEDK
jgi:hypothetical protein